MQSVQDLLNNPLFGLVRNLCGLFFVVLYFAVIFWTWRDANRRGDIHSQLFLIVNDLHAPPAQNVRRAEDEGVADAAGDVQGLSQVAGGA